MKLHPNHPFAEIYTFDARFAPAAYFFVFEALRYGQEEMGMGIGHGSEEHHVTGQELCEAIRQFAQDQFGFMAKCVLNSWGVQKTGDFGDIVFNLIQVGRMKKTDSDRREDFENVFDFDRDLQQRYRIRLPE